MNFEIVPNIIAMASSIIAIILLVQLARQMKGGSLSSVINLLVAGIALSVTIHAGAELANIYGLISEDVLFPIMGSLLSLGSILFIVAGVKGLQVFKQ